MLKIKISILILLLIPGFILFFILFVKNQAGQKQIPVFVPESKNNNRPASVQSSNSQENNGAVNLVRPPFLDE